MDFSKLSTLHQIGGSLIITHSLNSPNRVTNQLTRTDLLILMAGDPSGAKHRRNSDTESEQPSKRHRRHHRHNHRRHRRSRNHDEKDAEIEDAVEEKAESVQVNVAEDDEVEEGEILEEDEEFVAEKRRLDSSDVESGEIKLDADRNEVRSIFVFFVVFYHHFCLILVAFDVYVCEL